jgi:hypothetical protein
MNPSAFTAGGNIMRLPGFVAQASLYRTNMNYQGTAEANLGDSGRSVSAQWEFCTSCEPNCTRICCDPIGQFGYGCARTLCCPPGCQPCGLSTIFWPHTGVQACTDACCNTTVHACDFCKYNRNDHAKCIQDCVSNSCADSPNKQDCMDQCDCCCNSPAEETVCTDCLGETWIPGPPGRPGHCIAQ